MIRKLFFCVFLFCIVNKNTHAQLIKLYGFTQKLYGGANKESSIDENKNNAEAINNGQERFFLFAEICRNKRIKINQVWVGGNSYAFILDTVRSFPVVQYPFTANDTLIRYSSKRVLKFDLTKDPLNDEPAFFIRKKIQENSIVVVYQVKRKKCYVVLKNLKKLAPIFAP